MPSSDRPTGGSLWACLLFPSLPLDVFARALSPGDAQRPFVVGSGGHYPRVVAANRAARDAGIRDDQLLSGAFALAPDLAVRDRDAAAESHALAQLATWTLTFTPMACLAPPNAIVAEIGASLRLFGGLPRLVARLAGGAHALGYANRLGIAPTPVAALLLARAGIAQPVDDPARLPGVLDPLPLTLLDLPGTVRDTLRAAGVTTLGQAAKLPRDGLARRFGQEIVHSLDRALGLVPDPRAAFVPPPAFGARLDLPSPVHDADALVFGLSRLVRDLADWLHARGLGAVRLTLCLDHERYLRTRGLPATEVAFALGAPTRLQPHLMGVLRERLTRVTLPAPVEAMRLRSDETAPLAGRNLGLLPGDDADRVEVPLADRLRARLGEDALVRLAPRADHRPELASGARAASARHEFALPEASRPIWLLSEPQPLAAVMESRPWVLRDGPERIESGWWDGADIRRDYYVADTHDGATVWIYRDQRYGVEDGEWFLHGLFA